MTCKDPRGMKEQVPKYDEVKLRNPRKSKDNFSDTVPQGSY